MESRTQLDASSASPFPFLHAIERLKQTPRRGWLIRGIASPESVSDHMYRMAIMIWMSPFADEKVRIRAMKMALVHNIGEAIIGDITPSDGVLKEEKHRRERLAILYLKCLVTSVSPDFAAEIMELWSEFEEGTSESAHWVRATDAVECMDQAAIYEERVQRGPQLSEFMKLESRVELPQLQSWVSHLKQEREARWSNRRADTMVIFVLGGPGVGKSTLCARLARELGYVHISVGDLLREEAKSPSSDFADFIDESMRESIIIPPHLTIMLLRKRMNEFELQERNTFVIDGFPRSLDQAYAFEEKIHDGNHTIVLEGTEEVMLQRLRERVESSGRVDDNMESIERRLRTYADESVEVEKHLQETGRFWKINADASTDVVFESVKGAVESIFQK